MRRKNINTIYSPPPIINLNNYTQNNKLNNEFTNEFHPSDKPKRIRIH